jgi:hypothetical protein
MLNVEVYPTRSRQEITLNLAQIEADGPASRPYLRLHLRSSAFIRGCSSRDCSGLARRSFAR